MKCNFEQWEDSPDNCTKTWWLSIKFCNFDLDNWSSSQERAVRSWCNDQLSISKPVKQEKLMRSSETFVSRKHFYCSNSRLLQICQKDLMESTQTVASQTVSVKAPQERDYGRVHTVAPRFSNCDYKNALFLIIKCVQWTKEIEHVQESLCEFNRFVLILCLRLFCLTGFLDQPLWQRSLLDQIH